MKVGDTVEHVTYGWVGVITKYVQHKGYWVWWSGWPAEHSPDGPMQAYWLRSPQ